jgi:hypothetical protein
MIRSKDIEGFLIFFIIQPLLFIFGVAVFISGFFL